MRGVSSTRKLQLAIVIFLWLLSPYYGFAQEDKCGSPALMQMLQQEGKHSESTEAFEQWIAENRQLRRTAGIESQQVYLIPVVVHIIHNGEAFGIGANIPNEQIFNQINTLNEDFRRLNPDRTNTLSQFAPVAADARIEFVLAKRNPEGIATNGIVRKQGTREEYRLSDAGLLSEISYWPAEDYLNIWVAPLSGNLLGWGQFPLSNLPGLDNANTNRRIDGIVIDYEYFGTGFNARAFSRGRTATHEVGHFLGLRHIWGDGGCGVTDFVADTPDASSPTIGCALDKTTCESLDMVQNYMDYTNDVCMNLFTQGQVERMHIVLENSPRRRSLLTSKGGIEPEPLALDAGIRPINDFIRGSCDGNFQPSMEVRNYGINPILNFRAQLLLNGTLRQELFIQQELTSLQTLIVNFEPINLPIGLNIIDYQITSVNSQLDGNPTNDRRRVVVLHPEVESLGSEKELKLNEWYIYNPDEDKTWEIATDGSLAKMPFFNYRTENSFGQNDYLISPAYNISQLNFPVLRFEYAYSEANIVDGFELRASSNCGQTFSFPLFGRSGSQLATAFAQDTPFEATHHNDWVTEEIILLPLSFTDQFNLSFISTNGEGNNLLIRNVRIVDRFPRARDVRIFEAFAFPSVSCEGVFNRTVRVENNGSEPIQSFRIEIREDGQLVTANNINANLQSGQNMQINLPPISVQTGARRLAVRISHINGIAYDRVNETQYLMEFIHCSESNLFPFRLDFTQQNLSNWILSSSPLGLAQQKEQPSFAPRGSIRFQTSEAALLDRYWLISPLFSLENVAEASLTFKTAYQVPFRSNERIRVYLSDDCGRTYRSLLRDFFLDDFPLLEGNANTLGDSADEFVEHRIDLSAFAQMRDLRIAIELVSGSGNDVIISDMNLNAGNFVPLTLAGVFNEVVVFPNPAKDFVQIAFDYDTHRDVVLRITNMSGRIFTEKHIPNALNQQYYLPTVDLANGMYIIQIRSQAGNQSLKLLINR
jgi:hypothetical protein